MKSLVQHINENLNLHSDEVEAGIAVFNKELIKSYSGRKTLKNSIGGFKNKTETKKAFKEIEDKVIKLVVIGKVESIRYEKNYVHIKSTYSINRQDIDKLKQILIDWSLKHNVMINDINVYDWDIEEVYNMLSITFK